MTASNNEFKLMRYDKDDVCVFHDRNFACAQSIDGKYSCYGPPVRNIAGCQSTPAAQRLIMTANNHVFDFLIQNNYLDFVRIGFNMTCNQLEKRFRT